MIYRRIVRLITVSLEARPEGEAEHLNKTRVKLSKGTMGIHRALSNWLSISTKNRFPFFNSKSYNYTALAYIQSLATLELNLTYVPLLDSWKILFDIFFSLINKMQLALLQITLLTKQLSTTDRKAWLSRRTGIQA